MQLSLEHTHKTVTKRPKYELSDILKRYLDSYLASHRLSMWQRKVLYYLQICRTSSCGGHVEYCDNCKYKQPTYNSCHNRHCPKCQGISRRRWVAARLKELLPVPHYHVVFTLPHSLNDIALYNKYLIYNLFYHSAAYTLQRFAKDPKNLGGQLGFIGVLHTWGNALSYHVHWHFIVPGGGLTEAGEWKDLPYNDKYLFSVKAMSQVVRGRFIKYFKKAYYDGKIKIPSKREDLKDPVMFEYFLNDLASEKWVNYAKRPFGSAEQVFKYIGRYTHRVAISNHSLLNIAGGKIQFLTKDYKKGGIKEKVELPSDEFIRRFLLHILPKRFRKIRYGGFLAQAIRGEKLELARKSIEKDVRDDLMEKEEPIISDLEMDEYERCPRCHIGKMRAIDIDLESMKTNWHVLIDGT